MKYRLLTTLTMSCLASTVMADEYIYTYCQVEQDTSPQLAEQLAILTYNLSSAEIALHLKAGEKYHWFAGRRPGLDNGFSVQGDLEELNLALLLRDRVSRHQYFRASSEKGVSGLAIENPPDCISSSAD